MNQNRLETKMAVNELNTQYIEATAEAAAFYGCFVATQNPACHVLAQEYKDRTRLRKAGQ